MYWLHQLAIYFKSVCFTWNSFSVVDLCRLRGWRSYTGHATPHDDWFFHHRQHRSRQKTLRLPMYSCAGRDREPSCDGQAVAWLWVSTICAEHTRPLIFWLRRIAASHQHLRHAIAVTHTHHIRTIQLCIVRLRHMAASYQYLQHVMVAARTHHMRMTHPCIRTTRWCSCRHRRRRSYRVATRWCPEVWTRRLGHRNLWVSGFILEFETNEIGVKKIIIRIKLFAALRINSQAISLFNSFHFFFIYSIFIRWKCLSISRQHLQPKASADHPR